MLSLVAAIVSLGLVVILTLVALLGWGNLTWRALACERPARADTATAWLGYCAVAGVVEALHLFVAIDWKVTLLLGAIGLAGCMGDSAGRGQFHALWQRTAGLAARYPWQTGLLGLLVLSWCLRAMAVPNNYDSGLYHFQTIRWMNEEPIVFGIGNLHWRLALNQSYFGFLALMNLAPFWNKGYAAGGICLLLLTLATLIETGLGQSARWRWIFGAGLLVFLGVVAGSTVNPSPDNAVALLEVAIFLLLFRALQPCAADASDARRHAMAALILCVAVFCTKFSSAAFVLGIIVILAVTLLRANAIRQVFTARVVIFAAVLGAVHLARGFILSGAPFFPATWFGAWQLEWAVPIGTAQMETALIQSWARLPGGDLSDAALQSNAWIRGWFARQSGGTLALFATGFMLTLANLICLYRSRSDHAERAIFLLYVPTIAALAFWFLTAPDVRFLGAALVLFFLLSGYLAAAQLEPLTRRLTISRLSGAHRLAPLIFALACFGSARYVGLNSLSLSGWMPVPVSSTVEKRTDSGVIVRLPESGNQCWNAPIPCASLFNSEIGRAEIFSHSMFFTIKPQ